MGHERALRGCPPANKTAATLFKPEGEGYPLKRVWPAHARPVCKIKGWSPTNDVDLKHTRGTSPGPTVEQVEWESAVAPLSRGSRQRDLKNDVSLPPITPRVVAGPSLIETSPVSVWKTIYPRGGKSYKTRLCIRRQNIVDRYWNYRKNLSWKFLPMYQVLILRSIKKEMKRYKHYT